MSISLIIFSYKAREIKVLNSLILYPLLGTRGEMSYMGDGKCPMQECEMSDGKCPAGETSGGIVGRKFPGFSIRAAS